MMIKEVMVTIPPDVVRTRASSTVFVNASSRVNRDLAGMVARQIRVATQDFFKISPALLQENRP